MMWMEDNSEWLTHRHVVPAGFHSTIHLRTATGVVDDDVVVTATVIHFVNANCDASGIREEMVRVAAPTARFPMSLNVAGVGGGVAAATVEAEMMVEELEVGASPGCVVVQRRRRPPPADVVG
jgi:hypothetical protein